MTSYSTSASSPSSHQSLLDESFSCSESSSYSSYSQHHQQNAARGSKRYLQYYDRVSSSNPANRTDAVKAQEYRDKVINNKRLHQKVIILDEELSQDYKHLKVWLYIQLAISVIVLVHSVLNPATYTLLHSLLCCIMFWIGLTGLDEKSYSHVHMFCNMFYGRVVVCLLPIAIIILSPNRELLSAVSIYSFIHIIVSACADLMLALTPMRRVRSLLEEIEAVKTQINQE